ncbi:hypothetical protein SCLCIDRAFT_1207624 [Scleroderma citrinum Foug A]|uniref:Fork-head domain-containing protein n=1 Tax=Scleroderma citrinum Foug A TaxID=1036808 RepID=A0A0C3ER52_9AGAM|nr:hypothetical protein SCLCIDRAFT_1207624 [Scleroderma citrinum Foug A]
MSSIRNLLNPTGDRGELDDRHKLKDEQQSHMSTSDASASTVVERNSATPNIRCARHEPHLNCPDTLACLPDTDGRPQHTLPVILRCAILGSANKRLTIREIYAAMENKYAYFRDAGPTWKQSVRHHLSLNRLFERQPRPVTDPGFGSYWTVNLSAPPGTKRPRKRGRTSKVSEDPSEQKKRGRPRKKLEASNGSTSAIVSPELDSKTPLVSAAQLQIQPRAPAKGPLMEDEPDEYELSEVEYESEEDMVIPPNHHPSTSSLGTFGVCEGPSRVYNPAERSCNVYPDGDEGLIDRLQIENAGLRRQSADAISVSMRISDQLAEAHAEAARVRAALRVAESMLEEESRKRREAERVTQEEVQLRRAAEETVRRLHSRWENGSHAS